MPLLNLWYTWNIQKDLVNIQSTFLDWSEDVKQYKTEKLHIAF